MLTLNDGRNELWQWDTGRKLTVDAECSQVHFSNKVFGRSIDVDVVDGIAIIPDILLQTDKELTAWAFVGTPENGYTKISKDFKVNKRNKPADYVFTPPEQTTLAGLADRLDKIEKSQDPDAIKNAVDDYLKKNPVESPVQSVNGKTGEILLTSYDVGAISQDDLQEATNKALEQAKESGEFDGADGQPGADGLPGQDGSDGITPHIGDNGNWFIGETDTGNPSRGIPGEPGKDGKDGQDGKTPIKGEDYFTPDEIQEIAEQAAELVEVPEAPEISMQPLTFTGAVEATYDGSKAVNVEIPHGGGGKEWKLIWEKTFTEADLGTAFWEFTLDTPAEEIVVIDTNLRSEQAMGWHIKVNGLSVSTNAPYLTDDTKNRNRQTYCSYKGDVWKVDIGEYGYDALGMGAIAAVDTGPGAHTVVGKLPTVGKATSIRFAQSIQQNYQVFSGSVRMYVR